MPLGNEKAAVQNPFVKYAIEAGWTYLSPDEAHVLPTLQKEAAERLDGLFRKEEKGGE